MVKLLPVPGAPCISCIGLLLEQTPFITLS